MALTSYVLMDLPDSSASYVLTLWLLRAWRQNDFAFLQAVVGNGDNPFAALALDFEHIPAKFCDKLTAFASCFGRLELLSQPPGVFIKIHCVEKNISGNVTNSSQVHKNKNDFYF